MDEDEELWFNDEDCEDEAGESISSGSGEPDKEIVPNTCDKPEKIGDTITATETKSTLPSAAPSIDQVMEEDKKKELLKGVDIDPSTTTEAPTNINGGVKKSMALVDYNDSDSDGEENGGSSDEDLPPRKKLKT